MITLNDDDFGENMEEAIFLEGDAVSFIYFFGNEENHIK